MKKSTASTLTVFPSQYILATTSGNKTRVSASTFFMISTNTSAANSGFLAQRLFRILSRIPEGKQHSYIAGPIVDVEKAKFLLMLAAEKTEWIFYLMTPETTQVPSALALVKGKVVGTQETHLKSPAVPQKTTEDEVLSTPLNLNIHTHPELPEYMAFPNGESVLKFLGAPCGNALLVRLPMLWVLLELCLFFICY
jgi:hypothetical protein